MILAATGHRPELLGGHSATLDANLRLLATKVLTHLRPTQAVSGMALGWDMAWAEAALELGIPLVAAVPFLGQELLWPVQSQERYFRLLDLATEVVQVCTGEFARYKYMLRNEWMVDHADCLIALWSGAPGGTADCIAYAKRKKKDVKNLWPVWQAMNAPTKGKAA